MRHKWMRRGLKFAVLAVVGAAVLGFLVMNLWNWLAPAVFGAKIITFWQALGMLALGRLLFGGLRGGPGRHGHWRGRMRERWERMSPEEREKFRHGMRNCGGAGETQSAE